MNFLINIIYLFINNESTNTQINLTTQTNQPPKFDAYHNYYKQHKQKNYCQKIQQKQIDNQVTQTKELIFVHYFLFVSNNKSITAQLN